jgi:membrane protein DedA with SNARE-associated domain
VNLTDLIASHGYWIVALIVALECMGVPVPGETGLVTAAIFAGTTHRLNIWLVMASAAAGSFTGGSIGYAIGRTFGHRFLLKHGQLLHVDEKRIKLGQYLFKRHGGKVVFFGRFAALLRALASLLAGVNYMDVRRFMFFNAAGAMAWSLVFGLAAYSLGKELEQLRRSAALGLTALAVLGAAGAFWFIRRHEAALEAEAEKEFPGPIR